MFKMEDLKLGTKVLVFELSNKTCNTATIIGLNMDGDITVEYNGKREKLRKIDYKRNYQWWNFGITWCFPNSLRFAEHVQKKLHGENTTLKRKKVFADYSKYPHDNNKKQLEARLQKQRAFITKVIEQGYVWYKTDSYSENNWSKQLTPRIEFKNNNYYLLTPCGNTCAKKENKTLCLEKPM